MNSSITYADVERVLREYGFEKRAVNATHVLFENAAYDAGLFLPANRSNERVRPSHMAIVRRTIIESGIAEAPEIDAALEAEPAAA